VVANATSVLLPLRNDFPATVSQQGSSQLLVNILHLPILVSLKNHPLHGPVVEFLHQAFVNWHFNYLNPRLLPSLTRLNALDALLRNALVLKIPVEYLETDDHDSIFNSPCLSSQVLPTDLCPTTLQNTVTHHSWLDLFPIPGFRDNILQGISTGELDETQLSEELCCELLNLDATSTANLVIWGEAWDASSWECSPEFFQRWGHLLKGCPQVLDATNHWRRKRGEMIIEFPLSQ
jgi:hypothetical protein